MAAFTELVLTRIEKDFLVLPLSAVERVVPAVEPVRAPATEPGPPHVSIGGRVFPVWFGAALLGAAKVTLEPSDQMLVLRGAQPVVLWVSAVEEVLQAQVTPAVPGGAELISGWVQLDRRSLPVLEVASLFHAISVRSEGIPHVGP